MSAGQVTASPVTASPVTAGPVTASPVTAGRPPSALTAGKANGVQHEPGEGERDGNPKFAKFLEPMSLSRSNLFTHFGQQCELSVPRLCPMIHDKERRKEAVTDSS